MAEPCLATGFAAAMDRLGPFEPRPALAVAVSGGADSTALAILTRDWARRRDGSTLALVVDHGLRPTSADEARATVERLGCLGIPSRLLPLVNLPPGPSLAERARAMRYEILTRACGQAGILHLLLGHHAADQAETLAMRVLRESRTHGLACMSALVETKSLRLVRPLLGIDPGTLRSFLTTRGTGWIEDPSNQDTSALRPRLRRRLAAHAAGDAGLGEAISAAGRLRAQEEAGIGAELARRTTIRPEGFALLSPGPVSSAALGRLIRTIGGLPYPPSPDQIAGLAARPRPATVAGVRIMRAGRLGDGMLILREEAAVSDPIAARPDIIWDRRFRLIAGRDFPAGATIGKLGDDAVRFRGASMLPSSLLRTLPAVRYGDVLAAVPHLSYAPPAYDARVKVLFMPPIAAAGACFVPTP